LPLGAGVSQEIPNLRTAHKLLHNNYLAIYFVRKDSDFGTRGSPSINRIIKA